MSLVSSDAEGEQNEIRNLQEKLESTMRLVANLSGQLTELKEQVNHAFSSLSFTSINHVKYSNKNKVNIPDSETSHFAAVWTL